MRTYKANKVKYFKTEESQTKSINNSKNSFGREREREEKSIVASNADRRD